MAWIKLSKSWTLNSQFGFVVLLLFVNFQEILVGSISNICSRLLPQGQEINRRLFQGKLKVDTKNGKQLHFPDKAEFVVKLLELLLWVLICRCVLYFFLFKTCITNIQTPVQKAVDFIENWLTMQMAKISAVGKALCLVAP